MLTCISGIDYPNNSYRFQVVYELLSLKFNNRIRIKCFVNELIPVSSVEHVFLGASWWECEVWDMFGIFFLNQVNITRLLTDYGFQGFPLRKDFPTSLRDLAVVRKQEDTKRSISFSRRFSYIT